MQSGGSLLLVKLTLHDSFWRPQMNLTQVIRDESIFEWYYLARWRMMIFIPFQAHVSLKETWNKDLHPWKPGNGSHWGDNLPKRTWLFVCKMPHDCRLIKRELHTGEPLRQRKLNVLAFGAAHFESKIMSNNTWFWPKNLVWPKCMMCTTNNRP